MINKKIFIINSLNFLGSFFLGFLFNNPIFHVWTLLLLGPFLFLWSIIFTFFLSKEAFPPGGSSRNTRRMIFGIFLGQVGVIYGISLGSRHGLQVGVLSILISFFLGPAGLGDPFSGLFGFLRDHYFCVRCQNCGSVKRWVFVSQKEYYFGTGKGGKWEDVWRWECLECKGK